MKITFPKPSGAAKDAPRGGFIAINKFFRNVKLQVGHQAQTVRKGKNKQTKPRKTQESEKEIKMETARR